MKNFIEYIELAEELHESTLTTRGRDGETSEEECELKKQLTKLGNEIRNGLKKSSLQARLRNPEGRGFKHPLGGFVSPLRLEVPQWGGDYNLLKLDMKNQYVTLKAILPPNSSIEIEFKVWDDISQTSSCLATFNDKGFHKH